MNTSELSRKSEQAIKYLDSFEAWKLLRAWNIFFQENFQGTERNVSSYFKKNILDLKIVAFPNLEDDECAIILESNILEFFEIEAPLENLLTEKLFLVPYSIRDNLRKMLKSAILRNNERVGQLTISAWLSAFDQEFDPAGRDESATLSFINKNPMAVSLPSSEKQKLKKILHTYDYLLVYTLPETGEDLEEMKKMFLSEKLEYANQNIPPRYKEKSRPMLKRSSGSQHIPIREALDLFSKLGEQTITSFYINIRSFDRPVRPSIHNWIYDYTSHLGQTGHSSMDRTNFLFRSENTINLSSPEREKLGIILKSFDENTPLSIDAGRQEVVFEELLRKAAPQAPAAQRPAFPAPKNASSTNFIHHVERQPVRQAPSSSNVFAEPRQKSPSELFIRPYDRIGTSKKELSQSSAFVRPPSPKVRPFPSPTSREIPPGQTLDNSPKTSPAGFPQGRALGDNQKSDFQMKFANPYPSPGTHESKFEQKNDNIANVSFSEGIPKAPTAQFSARRMPETKNALGANAAPKLSPPPQKTIPVPQTAKPIYQRPQMNRNIIYPHLVNEFPSGKPEPRIKGNVVDLSMNNDQGTTNNKR